MDIWEMQSGDPEILKQMDMLKLMVAETRYVGERMQQGTMTPTEARAWLDLTGHDLPTEADDAD